MRPCQMPWQTIDRYWLESVLSTSTLAGQIGTNLESYSVSCARADYLDRNTFRQCDLLALLSMTYMESASLRAGSLAPVDFKFPLK
jgi:hypothetical protein